MPVLNTTSASTSLRAPNGLPTKTEPSSSASAASVIDSHRGTLAHARAYSPCGEGLCFGEAAASDAIAIDHCPVCNRQQDRAAQSLPMEGRVLAARDEPLDVHHPGLVRVKHDHV